MNSRAVQIIKRSVVVVMLVLLSLAIVTGATYLILKDNYHVVVPHKVYRSAQLDAYRLHRVIEADKIKTVLNLRGHNPGKDWYRAEVATSRKLKVLHVDIALSAYHLPAPTTFRHLIKVLDQAPKPMLLHCASGSDRSGMASAMVMLLKGASVKQARQQLDWYYGVTNNNSVGFSVLDHYQKWLQKRRWTSNRERFLKWVKHVNW